MNDGLKSRRRILKGLAAAPAVTMASLLSWAKTTPERKMLAVAPALAGLSAYGEWIVNCFSRSYPRTRRQEMLSVGALQPGKYRPRTRMDPYSLEELAALIKAQGQIQPISVRSMEGGRYEIIAGEQRWRAAQIIGVVEVPVLIRDVSDDAVLAMSLIENIQREDLHPLDEAAGIQRLIDECNMTHAQAAHAVGRSPAAVSNLLLLLQLEKPAQDMLMTGAIEMDQARALLAVPKAEHGRIAALVAKEVFEIRKILRTV